MIDKLKKIWAYGSSKPIQRIGIILMTVGFTSYLFWINKRGLAFSDSFDSYYFPRSRDFIFYHLYLYFIPLGILLSWGYKLLEVIKKWIFKESTGNASTLYFKNNQDAFKFATTINQAILRQQQLNVGIVQSLFFTKNHKPQFLVQIADTNRTILVCGFNDKHANLINKNDLIYWGFIESVEKKTSNDLDAIGHIVAILKPEFNSDLCRWAIKKDLTA